MKTDPILTFNNKDLAISLRYKDKILLEATGMSAKLAYVAIDYGKHSTLYSNIYNSVDEEVRKEALIVYDKIVKAERSIMITAEDFYEQENVTPKLKDNDKFAPIFNYHELIKFAEDYAKVKLSYRINSKEN